ncbi:MAG: hypothetical protein EAZ61_10150 [Oscillatoriales cyanobacterium]|nr:MAG: hypothetical protein EAZ61_10150 [Oscillatoriales cyanobacterium]
MTPNLILWASDEVLAEFINFRQTAALYADNPDRNPIMPFAKLMLAMRKDFGHKNNGVDENLVLASFINDIKLID